MSSIPKELRYTKDHEWVRDSGDPQVVEVGITDYAQGELGDVVFVELPKASASFKQRDVFGTIEAVKAVSELYAPVAGTILEFNKALEINKNSSLAHYRIAEIFFLQHNYQASANAYRDSLNGDGEPRWTEVWSHVQLGKIFDTTGQRERATNEYRQALQTNDNTAGALDEARRYMQKPYESPKGASGMQ